LGSKLKLIVTTFRQAELTYDIILEGVKEMMRTLRDNQEIPNCSTSMPKREREAGEAAS
jgi:hypothetical protein